MSHFFVPYTGDTLAAVRIKGHTFVVLSRERDTLEEKMELLGADNLRELDELDSTQEEQMLNRLADEVGGGIVIAPHDSELEDVLRDLEDELYWVH